MPISSSYPSQDCTDLTATIASSQTTSAEIDLSGTTLCGLIMPSAFTGTAVSLTMCATSGGTFVTVQDGEGSDLSIPVAASKYVPVSNLALTAGIRYLKIISNASEGAERIIRLVTRAV